MKKHSSKRKALIIALAVIVILILGAVGAVYGVTHGFYRSSNYTSDEDAMKDFTNVGEDTTGTGCKTGRVCRFRTGYK